MKTIARDGNRIQRLIFVSLFRERGRDIALPTKKVGMGGIIISTVCLLCLAAVFVLIYVAMP
jgi:hypothetical protein